MGAREMTRWWPFSFRNSRGWSSSIHSGTSPPELRITLAMLRSREKQWRSEEGATRWLSKKRKDSPHALSQHGAVIGGEEGNGVALMASTSSAADAVNVLGGIGREIVIDHHVDTLTQEKMKIAPVHTAICRLGPSSHFTPYLEIQATTHEVSADEDPNLALAKVLNSQITLKTGDSQKYISDKSADIEGLRLASAHLLSSAIGVNCIHINVLIDQLVKQLCKSKTSEKKRGEGYIKSISF